MLTPTTSPCHLTISHSENCAQAEYLKNALLELFREFGHKPPASLNGPAMNLSLLQTLMFWFVWLHYALGTWTYTNITFCLKVKKPGCSFLYWKEYWSLKLWYIHLIESKAPTDYTEKIAIMERGVCVCVCARARVHGCLVMSNSLWPCGLQPAKLFSSQARILELVDISYTRGSSQPRDRTHVSCIFCTGRRILCHWATWEPMERYPHCINWK